MLWSKPLDLTGQGEGVCIQVMSSDSKPRARQNRHKQGLNQTREKLSADFRLSFNQIDLSFYVLFAQKVKVGE